MPSETSRSRLPHSLSNERIARAYGTIDPPFRDTPQFDAQVLACWSTMWFSSMTPR